MSLSSSNNRLNKSSNGRSKEKKSHKKELYAECAKSDECDYGMVCALNEGKDKKECDEKKKCQEVKEKSLVCLRISNQDCELNKECYNNECVEGKCKPSAKKHMGSCSYHYLSEECEENTYCNKKGGEYKCLGGNDHPCQLNDECWGGTCGLYSSGKEKTCLKFSDRIIKSTLTYFIGDFDLGYKIKRALGLIKK